VSSDESGVSIESQGQRCCDVPKIARILSGDLNVVGFLGSLRSSTSAVATQGAEIELYGAWLSHSVGWSRGTPWRYAVEDLTGPRR
jgi:hypothetical protein